MRQWFLKRLDRWRAKKHSKIKLSKSIQDNGAKHWYEVEENLPDSGEWILGYSEVFGRYHLCRHLPSRGWLAMNGDILTNISHWCDDELFMPFEVRNEVNAFYAEKHGFKLN